MKMSTQPENPGFPVGGIKKRKRRSSILKTAGPFEEIQNVTHMDEKTLKDKRVSFCRTIEIKEFLKELPTQLGLPVHSGSEEAPEATAAPIGKVRKAELPPADNTFVQISTPKGKKRRRISSDMAASITRLSIIPNLEKSFVIGDEEDFEAYTDDLEEEAAATTALPEEITLTDVAPDHEPEQDINMNDFCDPELPAAKHPCVLPCQEPPTDTASSKPTTVHNIDGEVCDSQPPSLIANKDSSDMEITLIESVSKEAHMNAYTSLVSADEFLKGISVAQTNCSPCSQPGNEMNAFTSREPTTEPTSTMDLTCMEAKAEPSNAHDSDGPAEAERSHAGATSLETSLPQIGTTSDANWLQTTVDGSFPLIDSSPESTHLPTATTPSNLPPISSEVVGSLKDIHSSPHLNDTYKLLRPLLNTQALTDVHHHESPPSSQVIFLLRKRVDKIKMDAKQEGNDTICIATPEMVPLGQLSVDSSSPFCCSIEGIAHQTLSSSVLTQQSLAMSPSAFSKFLAALKCTPEKSNCEPLIVASPPPDGEGPSTSTSAHPFTNSTCSKLSQLSRDHRSPTLFIDHLQELHTRLLVAVNGLRLRLKDPTYLSAHPRLEKGLLRWYNAAHAGLCGIHTLMVFGKLSGLSASYCWDATSVPYPLPFPPSWEDDITGDNDLKAEWLEELHDTMLQVHNTAECALKEAARSSTEPIILIDYIGFPAAGFSVLENCVDNGQKIRAVQAESAEGYQLTSMQKGLIANFTTTTDIAQVLWRSLSSLSAEEP